MKTLKEIFKIAEERWKSYRPNRINGLDDLVTNSEYDNHNFYEFSKGYYFAYSDQEKYIVKLKASLKIAKNCLRYNKDKGDSACAVALDAIEKVEK